MTDLHSWFIHFSADTNKGNHWCPRPGLLPPGFPWRRKLGCCPGSTAARASARRLHCVSSEPCTQVFRQCGAGTPCQGDTHPVQESFLLLLSWLSPPLLNPCWPLPVNYISDSWGYRWSRGIDTTNLLCRPATNIQIPPALHLWCRMTILLVLAS